jgi:hypothetical protein
VPIVLKYGSLKLLESSGPVQACNGVALLLQFELHVSALFSAIISYYILKHLDEECYCIIKILAQDILSAVPDDGRKQGRNM